MKAINVDINKEYLLRSLEFEPLDYQRQFYAAGATAVERFLSAGNGIGKTTCFRKEIQFDATGYYPDYYEGIRYKGHLLLWVFSTMSAIVKTNLYDFLIGTDSKPGLIHPSLILYSNKLSMTAVIRRKDGGITNLEFKSYKQSLDSVKGLRVNKIYCDEEPPFDMYVELLARGISVLNFRMVTVSTPDENKQNTPFLSYFHDDPDLVPNHVSSKGKYLQIAGWKDSPYFPEAERERYRAILTPEQLLCREFGLPYKGAGLIYSAPESSWSIEPFEIPKHWARGYGLDVGWRNKTAALFFAYDRDNRILYFTGEYYMSEKTPEAHSFYLKQMGAEWMTGVVDPAADSVDKCTGETVYNMYVSPPCGLKLVKSTNRKKELAIAQTREMYAEGRIKVFNNLVNFRTEIKQYARKGNGEIKKENDHLMDAKGYVILDGLNNAISLLEYERSKQTYNNNKPWYF